MTQLREAAVSYAELGWKVLPLVPGEKAPATKHGFKDATNDIATVEVWWTKNPDYNIGLATGHDFDVVDIDSKSAFDRMIDYLGTQGLETYVPPMAVATPRGQHWYFQPTGQGCKVGLIKGVDYRGEGGYVVAPPSVISDSGTSYHWLNQAGPFLPVPQPLRDLVGYRNRPVKNGPAARFHDAKQPSNYGVQALSGALLAITEAREGERNHVLNREAYSIYRSVAGGQIPMTMADRLLRSAGISCGLDEEEVRQTLDSARYSGVLSPRSLDTL